MSLSEQLRAARIEKGFKQDEVAEMVGVKKATVSNYETGATEPNMDIFLKLCDIYEKNPNTMLEWAYNRYNKASTPADLRFKRLTDNYDKLNEVGKDKLAEYSDDLASNPANLKKQNKQVG